MEIWKTIIGFEDYQVSNLGNVRSFKLNSERLLKQNNDGHGYLKVTLSKNGVLKNFKTHVLVASIFLNHKTDGTNKLVVNHIDLDKKNNKLVNLEIITNRENSNRKHLKHSSKYTGVSWCKQTSRWRSLIYIDGRLKSLGRFLNEYDAHLAYENELKLISLMNG